MKRYYQAKTWLAIYTDKNDLIWWKLNWKIFYDLIRKKKIEVCGRQLDYQKDQMRDLGVVVGRIIETEMIKYKQRT